MIAVAALVLIALLMPLIGGSLTSVGLVALRHERVVLVLFAVQGVLRGRLPGFDEPRVWAIAAWSAVCVTLILLLVPSRHVAGVPILMLGLGSNLWVTLLNRGMPYLTTDGRSISHGGEFYRFADSSTSFAWMGDVLPDPTFRSLLSLGDVLLLVGFVVVVLHASMRRLATNNPG